MVFRPSHIPHASKKEKKNTTEGRDFHLADFVRIMSRNFPAPATLPSLELPRLPNGSDS